MADGVRRPRPLSPHLQVYKPQLTTVLSIMHRATGIALTLGLLLFAWWMIGLGLGPDRFEEAKAFLTSPLGVVIVTGWIWAWSFHLGTGIRHLFWDAGKGFSIEATYRSGWAVVIGSFLLTIAWLVWVVLPALSV